MSQTKEFSLESFFNKASGSLQDFIPWVVDSLNDAYQRADWLKALTKLGGNPHPNYVKYSGMPKEMVRNFTKLRKEYPAVYTALKMQYNIFAGMDGVARLDQAIMDHVGEDYSDIESATMGTAEAVQAAYGKRARDAFDAGMAFSDVATNMVMDAPDFLQRNLQSLLADMKTYVQKVDELVTLLRKFYDIFEKKLEPNLDKWLQYVVDDILPAFERLNANVMEPYLSACEDAKSYMDGLSKRMAEERTRNDSSVPAIIGNDNINPRELQALSTALNLPIIGVIYSSQLNALMLVRYGAQQGRGFLDEISMMQAAKQFPSAMMPIQSMLGALEDDATRPPVWFMRN